ncbi:MAG: polymer-forming cytoskeletal protein [Myxococcota bacterium]
MAPEAPRDVALAEGAVFEGLVVLPRPARIDGEVRGQIVAEALVWVGPTGRVHTDVQAAEVVVEGSVEGDIAARGRLTLGPGAVVRGDVTASALEMAEGARVNGHCRCGPTA